MMTRDLNSYLENCSDLDLAAAAANSDEIVEAEFIVEKQV